MEMPAVLRLLRGAARAEGRCLSVLAGAVLRPASVGGARGLASAPSSCPATASTSAAGKEEQRCKLLVVGGGAGGCSLAAKFARMLPPGEVVVLEPTDMHFYQPMFTLVGCGIKKLSSTCRPMAKVLPKRARWIQDAAAAFHPDENLVETERGARLRYDFLLVAMGLELRFQDIPGLEEALSDPESGVCSNYSPRFVEKTWECLQELRGGDALFTFPNSPIKCAGAPQKIFYLADDYLRRVGRRDDVHLQYHTCLPNIFGVKYYADTLWSVVERRSLDVELRSQLVEVLPEKRQAVFVNVDDPSQRCTLDYSFLHVAPPQGPPAVLKTCAALADEETGFLSVDKHTLQHTVYPNVFGVGDCTSLPTSKTAAAAAAQSAVLKHTLICAMEGKSVSEVGVEYDGYTSCPLLTAKGKCVMAEFNYDLQPIETFPFDQRKERWTMYQAKVNFMPHLYWHLMLNGYWEGPGILRKILHLGFGC